MDGGRKIRRRTEMLKNGDRVDRSRTERMDRGWKDEEQKG
jgi:hypothetical protein